MEIPEEAIEVETTSFEDRLFDFIVKFEWYSECSYWDVRQWSIWYWTPSFNWECIDEIEARKRKMERIERDINRYDLNKYPDNVKIAVLSFVYNIWSLNQSQQRLLKNHHYKALWNNFLLYRYAWWKILAWLEKRRRAERELLFTK